MAAQVLFRNTNLLCLCGSIPDLHNVILRDNPGNLSLQVRLYLAKVSVCRPGLGPHQGTSMHVDEPGACLMLTRRHAHYQRGMKQACKGLEQ